MSVNQDLWCDALPTVISADQAADHLGDDECRFVDARFDFADPTAGHRRYLAAHIPDARHVDLARDLSGPVRPGTGRHPMPSDDALVALAGRLGVTGEKRVVVYDEGSGAMAAARAWWLLRYLGHQRVAVLDGGLAAWQALGLPVSEGPVSEGPVSERPVAREAAAGPRLGATLADPESGAELAGEFGARFQRWMAVSAKEVANQSYQVLVDSRSRDRYRGDAESIDAVAGHIPGAICLPFSENLAPSGLLRSPEELRQRFAPLLRAPDPTKVVFYCGSGVTAAHNVLAFARASGSLAAMYLGSWSEWITDPDRPLAVGD